MENLTMKKKEILITPRSFGKNSKKAENMLIDEEYKITKNQTGKPFTESEMIDNMKNKIAVIVGIDPINKKVIDSSPQLRVISKYGSGVDNIDIAYAKEKGIKLFTTENAPVEAVADFTFALLLATARDLINIDRACRNLDWAKNISVDVNNKTLGIIGLGKIGKAVAQRASGFRMRIVSYVKNKDNTFAEENNIELVTFDEIFKESDFITIHLPLIESTKNIITKRQLDLMKSNSIIINTSRGGIVNENDLYKALVEGTIRGAGIDVFETEPPYESKILQLSNVVLGTHCSSSTIDTIDKMSVMSAKAVIDYLKASQ